MDTVLTPQPSIDPSVPEALQPGITQPDVAAQVDPTSPLDSQTGAQPDVSTSEVEAQPTPSAPAFDVDEYLRLKQEHDSQSQRLQEQDRLMNELRRMAEEQQSRTQQQQLRSEIQQEIASLLKKSGVEDEEIAEIVTGVAFGRIDQTRTAYEQQMNEWQAQAEATYQDALWMALKDNFAADMMSKYQLDPVYLPRLKQAGNDTEMVVIAEALRDATQLYKKQAYTQTVQEQEAQRRASGVDVITGTNSGPTIAEPLKPGSRKDLEGVLASLFRN